MEESKYEQMHRYFTLRGSNWPNLLLSRAVIIGRHDIYRCTLMYVIYNCGNKCQIRDLLVMLRSLIRFIDSSWTNFNSTIFQWDLDRGKSITRNRIKIVKNRNETTKCFQRIYCCIFNNDWRRTNWCFERNYFLQVVQIFSLLRPFGGT